MDELQKISQLDVSVIKGIVHTKSSTGRKDGELTHDDYDL